MRRKRRRRRRRRRRATTRRGLEEEMEDVRRRGGRRRDSTQSVRVEGNLLLSPQTLLSPVDIVSRRDITFTNRGKAISKTRNFPRPARQLKWGRTREETTMTTAGRDTAYIVEITSGKPGNRVCCLSPPPRWSTRNDECRGRGRGIPLGSRSVVLARRPTWNVIIAYPQV